MSNTTAFPTPPKNNPPDNRQRIEHLLLTLGHHQGRSDAVDLGQLITGLSALCRIIRLRMADGSNCERGECLESIGLADAAFVLTQLLVAATNRLPVSDNDDEIARIVNEAFYHYPGDPGLVG